MTFAGTNINTLVTLRTKQYRLLVRSFHQETDEPNLQHIADLIGQSHASIVQILPEALRNLPSIAIRDIELGVHPFSPAQLNYVSFL